MSKIRAIAERLRSESENERLTATNMIESQSGFALLDIIKKGAIRELRGEPQNWVLDHTSSKTGDRLIVAVSREIAALKTSWGDIVESGIQGLATRPAPSSSSPWPQPEFVMDDSWTAAFSSFMEAAGDSLWDHVVTDPPLDEASINSIYQNVRSARAGMKSRPARVGRDDLPQQATGVPHITRSGTAKTGSEYAVVSFRRMTAFGGEEITPMCEFIAFGSDWVELIQQAEATDTSVSVTFGEDRSPNKHVLIKNAL